MSEVIVVTSGKGGVGKTTITANLSIALSKLGKKVIAIDTDIGLRNLDVVMGLENHIIYNIVDVIEGNCRLHQAIIKDRKHSNLYLLPSAQSKDKDICLFNLVIFVITGHRCFDFKMIQQFNTVSGIFCRDQIHFLQCAEYSKCNIFQISDWGCTKI